MSNLLPMVDSIDIGKIKAFENSTIITDKGEFVDFFGDSGTVSFGYGIDLDWMPPHLPEYIKTEYREKAAETLCEIANYPDGYAFFSNSGSESVETMIKFARKFTGKTQIYTLKGNFHGRTYGAMSASFTKPYHRKGYGPFLPECYHFENPMFDINWQRAAAVILTPARVYDDFGLYDKKWLKFIVKKCKMMGVLLCFDEVQTYLRLGKWWGHQIYDLDIKPDMICTAKGVAGGIPTGVTLMKKEIGDSIVKGGHFSTFGGNLKSCQGVLYTIRQANEMLPAIRKKGLYLKEKLKDVGLKVRGEGLIISFDNPGFDALKFRDRCLKKGLILGVFSSDMSIKITPPLNITEKEMNKGLEVIKYALDFD